MGVKDSGQAGATIKVTPQMIEAGVYEFDFCRGGADEYELVARVYRAMHAAQDLGGPFSQSGLVDYLPKLICNNHAGDRV